MRFVVFDLEANADHPRPERQEIIEIGALLIENGKVVDDFVSLVAPSPGRPLAPVTVELTGLTDQALQAAPPRAPTLNSFLEFCGDRPLVAHNGSTYDFPLLNAELRRAGLPELLGERLDTLELAHVVFPRAGRESTPDIGGNKPPRSRRLSDLAHHYGIGENGGPAHRALSDTRMVWGVMRGLLSDLNRQDPTRRAQRWLLEVTGHPWAAFCESAGQTLENRYRPDLVKIITLPPEQDPSRWWDVFGELVEEEERQEIDVEELVHPLTPDGLADVPNMEHRPSQETMAREVATALSTSQHLMVEAPTGTGKTLAYLIPACRLASSWDTQVLISTYTKALQDQVCLTLNDLSDQLWPVNWTVLKGLGNYLSVHSLSEELGMVDPLESPTLRGNPLFSEYVSESASDNHLGLALAVVVGWAAETPSGEWDDLRDRWLRNHNPAMNQLRSRLSMTETPTRARGDLEKRCFFLRALKRLSEAQIVVANHSLMLIRDQMTAEIPRLVVDEAHELESAARSAFTLEASEPRLWRFLNMVYRNQSAGNLLYRYLRLLPAGTARDRGQRRAEQVVRYWRRCPPQIEEVRETLVDFFADTRGFGGIDQEQFSARITRVDLRRSRWNTVCESLSSLAEALFRLGEAIDTLPVPDQLAGGRSSQELRRRITQAGTEAKEAAELLSGFVGLDMDGLLESAFVCDLEPWEDQWNWRLRVVPLEVQDRLGELWEEKKSVVMTSATLTVAGSFDYIAAGLGFDHSHKVALETPFPDLDQQMLVVIPGYLPAPSGSTLDEFAEATPEELARLFEVSRGRGLALFTANRRMDRAADYLRSRLFPAFAVLCQGEASTPELTENFRKPSRPTCLLGSGTFWQGIDVPGDALSLLVMEKLPFKSPDEPVVSARQELIARRGGRPFEEYLLPEAVLGFRQGAGRLIRSRNDRGVLVVLDKRLGFARYAASFLDSLVGSPPVLKAPRPSVAYRAISRHLETDPDVVRLAAAFVRR